MKRINKARKRFDQKEFLAAQVHGGSSGPMCDPLQCVFNDLRFL